MSLVNQTAWVVGGVGVVGRGITRGLLQAGATVIVNSRSEERLERIKDTLGNPDGLITVHGSLLPGHASNTVTSTLKDMSLNHVVAHGAVRWWARPTAGSYEFYEYRAGCDESYALNIRGDNSLLNMKLEEFATSSSALAMLHLSAAQKLMPRLEGPASTYTFVTGDGSGQPNGERTAMGEINSHHVWGLSAALRHELADDKSTNVVCQEVRVGLPVQDKPADNKRPLSEAVGNICAGIASSADKGEDQGRLIKLDSYAALDDIMNGFDVEKVQKLPHYECDQQGAMTGSL